jgi:hypothetical protein
MTNQLVLEWIKETCDAYCIPKPFAIVEALEAARATAEQRDSVIDLCAKAADTSMLNCGCAAKIRALKSQQDAAIESKPAESSEPATVPYSLYVAGCRDFERVAARCDDAAEIIAALQKAIAYWMPKVFDERSAHDAYLLVGYNGENEPSYWDTQKSAWQPIETAPRDGTEVILWATRHSMLMPHPERIIGAFRNGWWSGPSTLSHVTHWQPLPTPPADAAVESQRSGDGSCEH